jgi:hypothetical protein
MYAIVPGAVGPNGVIAANFMRFQRGKRPISAGDKAAK